MKYCWLIVAFLLAVPHYCLDDCVQTERSDGNTNETAYAQSRSLTAGRGVHYGNLATLLHLAGLMAGIVTMIFVVEIPDYPLYPPTPYRRNEAELARINDILGRAYTKFVPFPKRRMQILWQ